MNPARIKEVIGKRTSVRSYDSTPLSDNDLASIEKLIARANTTVSPFDVQPQFHLLTGQGANDGKLGTYGIIRGTNSYVGATIKDHPRNLEAVGYAFEELILSLTAMDIGTCWLGGTFKRDAFKSAMGIEEHMLFPIISPIGYPATKRKLVDKMMRTFAKSDQRKAFGQVFFNGHFTRPLRPEDAGSYKDVLESVRLAPSASNKQPWRIVKSGDTYHFYQYTTPGYSDRLPFDIQRIDMGIAFSHFHLTAMALSLPGQLVVADPGLEHIPEHVAYCFSWQGNPTD